MRWDLIRDPSSPYKFTIYEVYEDEEAFAFHEE